MDSPGSGPSSRGGLPPCLALRPWRGPGVTVPAREWFSVDRMAGASWGILARLAGRSGLGLDPLAVVRVILPGAGSSGPVRSDSGRACSPRRPRAWKSPGKRPKPPARVTGPSHGFAAQGSGSAFASRVRALIFLLAIWQSRAVWRRGQADATIMAR